MDILQKNSIKTVLDCTFGNGGYTRELLKKYNVTSIDCDLQACELGKSLGFDVQHLNFRFFKGNFDVVIYDLGICTNQLSNRGFSYRESTKLDMRMDTTKELSAFNVVNDYHLDEIANVLIKGEEKMGFKIAKRIIQQRQKSLIHTSGELSNLVLDVKNMKGYKGVKHPAALTFQAIRMHVNNELENLKDSLINCEKQLQQGSMVFIVTFHSLEDRLVKHFFKSCMNGKRDFRDVYEISKKDGGKYHRQRVNSAKQLLEFEKYGSELEVENKMESSFTQYCKVIKPSAEEIRDNPRARSAKLRIYVRTSAPPIYS